MKVIINNNLRKSLKRILPPRIVVILKRLLKYSEQPIPLRIVVILERLLKALKRRIPPDGYLRANEIKLLIAIFEGSVGTIKDLHSQGVNIHASNNLALLLAAANGHLDVAKYLSMNGADLRILDDLALQLAAAGGHVELVRYLHMNGANLHACDNVALLAAAERGNVEVIRYLNVNGVDVRINNDAAIKLASGSGHVRCVEFLQRAGCIKADENIVPSLKPLIYLYLDVFGYCNLRCPSCPVKNWPRDDMAFEPDLMTEDLLRRILDKATRETTIAHIGLFNWTEPLLNPKLPQLIEVVNAYGIGSSISSNLNVLHDADALMKTNPSWFRVSVSGFRQEIYERGHRWGDVEKVKNNMRALAEAKARHGVATELELFFHRYIDNEEDEAPMKAYAEGLGYKFLTGWAYMMPLEKVLTYADPEHPEAVLTEEDLAVMDRLALRMNAMLDACSRHKLTSCTLQDDFLTLNVKGDVFLCCASSGRAKNMIGNFLELPFDEIQQRKREHSLCGKCMKRSLPVYLNQTDQVFDDIGASARAEFYSRAARSKGEHKPAIKV